MPIQITSDMDDLYDELDRLEHEPTAHMSSALSRIMTDAFRETQEDVHVITGQLKASGVLELSNQDGQWSGTISYGNDTNVDYAVFEMDRGGSHNFMRNVHLTDDRITRAILENL